MTRTPTTRRLITVGIPAALAATLVNAGIYRAGHARHAAYVIAKTAHGVKLVHLGDVAFSSLSSFAVGLLAVVVAVRLGKPRLRALRNVGLTAAVASIAKDLPLPSTATAKVTLAAMHLIVGLAYAATLYLFESAQSTPGTADATVNPTNTTDLRLSAAA